MNKTKKTRLIIVATILFVCFIVYSALTSNSNNPVSNNTEGDQTNNSPYSKLRLDNLFNRSSDSENEVRVDSLENPSYSVMSSEPIEGEKPANSDTSKPDGFKINEQIKAESDNFVIVYYPNSDVYDISILTAPFESNRKVAEEKFLEVMNLDKDSACKLEVYVIAPRYVDLDASVANYGLSWCR